MCVSVSVRGGGRGERESVCQCVCEGGGRGERERVCVSVSGRGGGRGERERVCVSVSVYMTCGLYGA